MEKINLGVNTGKVTYQINGGCELSINPTDSGFVERLFTAFDALDKKQEAYKTEVEKNANKREVFEVARRMDEETRDIINEIFGFDVCGAVFGGMNAQNIQSGQITATS